MPDAFRGVGAAVYPLVSRASCPADEELIGPAWESFPFSLLRLLFGVNFPAAGRRLMYVQPTSLILGNS